MIEQLSDIDNIEEWFNNLTPEQHEEIQKEISMFVEPVIEWFKSFSNVLEEATKSIQSFTEIANKNLT